MSKITLSVLNCKTLKCPPDKALVSVTDHIVKGLVFKVSNKQNKTWIARLFRDGQETQRGIGSYPQIGLAEARDKKREFDSLWANGIDPRVQKRKLKFESKQANAQTFEEVQELCFANKIKGMSASHQKRWRGMYKNYLKTPIGILPLKDIDDVIVLEIIEKIYISAPQTALKVKNLISVVFTYALEKKWFRGVNPCLMLQGNSLIKKPKNENYKHLEEHRVGEFLTKLDSNKQIDINTKAFLYIILMTALRTNSLRQSKFSWIGSNVMTIPKEFMKSGEAFRCPLSSQVVDMLNDHKKTLRAKNNDYIFQGLKDNAPISDATARLVLQEIMEEKYHIHGLRTTWNRVVTQSGNYQVEHIESQLTHAFTKTQLRKTYLGKLDHLDKRKDIVQYFNDWCDKQVALYKGANGTA